MGMLKEVELETAAAALCRCANTLLLRMRVATHARKATGLTHAAGNSSCCA